MAYFQYLSHGKAPSSLWSIYSMLKKTLRQYDNVDISEYKNLVDFLKVQAKGYENKKAKVFTPTEMEKFLSEAPDEEYLVMKVNI